MVRNLVWPSLQHHFRLWFDVCHTKRHDVKTILQTTSRKYVYVKLLLSSTWSQQQTCEIYCTFHCLCIFAQNHCMAHWIMSDNTRFVVHGHTHEHFFTTSNMIICIACWTCQALTFASCSWGFGRRAVSNQIVLIQLVSKTDCIAWWLNL